MPDPFARFAWPKPPTTLGGFLDAVHEIHSSWTDVRGIEHEPWFRGHADPTWSLTPSLFRGEYKDTEEDSYRHEFHLRAHPYLQDATYRPQTDFDWYALMQHHGTPTRLLDWSESALVALHFALSGAAPDGCAVWMLNPWMLNKDLARIDDIVPDASDHRMARYLSAAWSGETLPKAPAAFQPPYNSRRIAAQRGVFTVHGKSKKGMEAYAELEGHLSFIRIPGKATKRIRFELDRAGIRESTLFPELAGLCREIRDAWKGVE